MRGSPQRVDPYLLDEVLSSGEREIVAELTAMQLVCFRLAALQESGAMTAEMAFLAKLHDVRKAKLICSEARASSAAAVS